LPHERRQDVALIDQHDVGGRETIKATFRKGLNTRYLNRSQRISEVMLRLNDANVLEAMLAEAIPVCSMRLMRGATASTARSTPR